MGFILFLIITIVTVVVGVFILGEIIDRNNDN